MICNVDKSTATNFQHLSRLRACLVIDITCVLECIG
jgi:hypothetical protein